MYRSPIALSGLNPADFTADAPPRAALLLARRKLEAELELNGGDAIEINGTTLSRQDIITIFDELSDEKKLRYHLAIAGDPPLLRFLETATIDAGAHWQQNDLYEDSGFLFFISQHYAEATDALYRSVLKRNQNVSALQTLAANPSLMLGGDSERAFRAVTRYFIDQKNALLHLLSEVKGGHNHSKDEVNAVATEEDIYVLNSLPDGFEDLRYEIASTLNNICVAFDKRSRPKPALAAIERAATIHLEGGELITLIPNNLKLVRNKQPGFRFFNYGDNGKKTPKVGAIIALFVLVIRIFGGMNGCNDQSYQSSPDLKMYGDYPVLNYRTNMARLLSNLAGASSTATYPTTDTVRLSKPVEGVMPFQGLYRLVDGDSATGYIPSATGNAMPKNQIRLVNGSPWDVIIFYTQDQSTTNSFYVPAGKTKTLNYVLMALSLDFTAGSNWDASESRLLTAQPDGLMVRTHRISGWYSRRPSNLESFVQSFQALLDVQYDSTAKSALVLTFGRAGTFADSITLNIDTVATPQSSRP